jgi:ADP-heptose:LPS heptosyltransferase
VTASSIVPGVQKIAVLRANAIGDYLFATPALSAIKQAYRDAELILLGCHWHHAFLVGRPGPVDRVIVVPTLCGINAGVDAEENQDDIDRFLAAMHDERIDIAVQIHGGGRYSNPLVRRLGARLTVGLRADDAPCLDRWIPYVHHQYDLLRYLEVVSLIGAQTVHLDLRIAVTPSDRKEAAAIPVSRPFVVLQPGASTKRRQWPTDRFARIGDHLAARGFQIVVHAGPGEEEIAAKVVDSMQRPGASIGQQLSVSGLAGLLADAALVVSNCTGPVHLAAAVGTPTVSVVWCADLLNWGYATGAAHRALISWQLDCPCCGARMIGTHGQIRPETGPCPHSTSFVDSITVEEVISGIESLIGRRDHGGWLDAGQAARIERTGVR